MARVTMASALRWIEDHGRHEHGECPDRTDHPTDRGAEPAGDHGVADYRIEGDGHNDGRQQVLQRVWGVTAQVGPDETGPSEVPEVRLVDPFLA